MPHTILVVDDEAHVRRLIEVNLERAGYVVILAKDGEAALASLARAEVDLVVLDWEMPSMEDGLEVLRRMRNDPEAADLPVIMLTPKVLPANTPSPHLLEPTAFLSKPFNPMDLLLSIRRILEYGDGPDPPDVGMRLIA